MKYEGDISQADAQILAELASRSFNILEFGVGASTQVIDYAAPPVARFTTVDTSPEWIEKVKPRVSERVHFLLYDAFRNHWTPEGPLDMVFVDGIDDRRLEFAMWSWPWLKITGSVLFHDTRRAMDVGHVCHLLQEHFLEIESVRFNWRASNITIVRKKIREPYVNWNIVEGRY